MNPSSVGRGNMYKKLIMELLDGIPEETLERLYYFIRSFLKKG